MKIHHNKLSGLSEDHILAEFDSASEMLAAIPSGAAAVQAVRMTREGGFYGNLPWDKLSEAVTTGDAATAKAAKALLSKINAGMPATVKRVRTSRPFGRVVTGAYLAGDPMPARARVKVHSPNAPVLIAVNLSSSAMTGIDSLRKRGVAIAALVQKVAMTRPVDLRLIGSLRSDNCGSIIASVKFPTAPVDSHRLAFLLSHQGFGRAALFALSKSCKTLSGGAKGMGDNFSADFITWPGGYDQEYVNRMDTTKGATGLGADLAKHYRKKTVYIPGAGAFNPDYAKMINDPVQWINETIAKLA